MMYRSAKKNCLSLHQSVTREDIILLLKKCSGIMDLTVMINSLGRA